MQSSIAVFQDVTGKAHEKAQALAVAVGSGYSYETTFEKEVYSDLYGERGVLMGGIQGLFLAQYKVLRDNGHSPSEAFNETVEEATQSLYPLIGQYGSECLFIRKKKMSSGVTDHAILLSLFCSGLHVQRMLHHRPPWCSRLVAQVLRGQRARLRAALRLCQGRQRDPPIALLQQQPHLPPGLC